MSNFSKLSGGGPPDPHPLQLCAFGARDIGLRPRIDNITIFAPKLYILSTPLMQISVAYHTAKKEDLLKWIAKKYMVGSLQNSLTFVHQCELNLKKLSPFL